MLAERLADLKVSTTAVQESLLSADTSSGSASISSTEASTQTENTQFEDTSDLLRELRASRENSFKQFQELQAAIEGIYGALDLPFPNKKDLNFCFGCEHSYPEKTYFSHMDDDGICARWGIYQNGKRVSSKLSQDWTFLDGVSRDELLLDILSLMKVRNMKEFVEKQQSEKEIGNKEKK